MTQPDAAGLRALLTVMIADMQRLLAAMDGLPDDSLVPALVMRQFWPLHMLACRAQVLADLAFAAAQATRSPADDPPASPSPN